MDERTHQICAWMVLVALFVVGFTVFLGCATDPDGNVVIDTVALREVFVLALEIYEYMELMEETEEPDPSWLLELEALGDEVIAYWQTAEGQAEILEAVQEFRRRFEEMRK